MGRHLPNDFRYASNTNSDWLTVEQIRQIVEPIEVALGANLDESGLE